MNEWSFTDRLTRRTAISETPPPGKKSGAINYWKEAWLLSALGISFVLAVFIGLFFGIYLDKVLNTSPVFTFVFLGMGVAAGYRNMHKAYIRAKEIAAIEDAAAADTDKEKRAKSWTNEDEDED